ncbi:Cytochrome P450 monooxygenase lepH [Lachnellula suecica]|uniref:Cytochrome P450 monooxygenase lepH n=1 Tax=Lachnellula suecica TaxID=602035 RepID=A0A8T9C3C2_9HELO|nr:Cytochrome P450 monooxygenase lepH [Lachnellula suecica]
MTDSTPHTSLVTLSLTFILPVCFIWASTALTRYYKLRYAIKAHGCKPARFLPQWDPIWGLDAAVQMFRSYGQGNRSAIFKEQHATYGPTFQSLALGKIRIFTIDPVNLQSIFNADFQSWGVQPLRLAAWKPLLGAGVMDTDGPHWRFSRDMVQPLFRREQISDLSAFSIYTDRLLEHIPRDGSTVDMQPLFARLILDFTMEFLFGVSSETLTSTPDKDAMGFLEAFHYGQAGMGKRTQLPYLMVFNTDAKFRESCVIVRGFVDKYIERARGRLSRPKVDERRYILVDELLKQDISGDELRSQLLNVFLAAHDTTAVLMTNTIFNLARNPEVYKNLRAEILQEKSVPLTIDGLKRFKYLQNVVTETSRLTPVVGQSARIALKDTTIPRGGGDSGDAPIYVQRGTSVQFNYFALHRRAEVYGKDAEAFRPSRWDELKIGTWDFLPFIGGPRVCPANQMAFWQVCYTTARIVHQFNAIENRDPVLEFVEQYRITTDSKNGCKVGMRI